MRRHPLIPLATLALLASACGCVFGDGNSASAEEPTKPTAPVGEAQVAPQWQKHMLTQLEAAKPELTDAWGLFSEGGWSDSGQVIVLASKDRATLRLVVVNPNRQEVGLERALTPAEFKTLESVIGTAKTLEDIDVPSFDGLVFEYVHARRDGGKTTVLDRVFVRNAGQKPIPRHEALFNGFQALRPPTKG